ncbi:MAG: hypothetical protein B1H08_06015 [Candidatus Omnitrophica bacterium 4484_171]|nr:MAG: hypothetical protein B1H08_06015 [Candidatus Omnitrophica bacterium 4484_171]
MRFRRKKIDKLLGEILVEKDIITPQQLREVLDAQAKEDGLIGEIIVNKKFATEEDIAQCISFQYGFPFLPLENYDIPIEVAKIVPKNVAQHYCLVPIDKIGDTLTVAMANPLNMEAAEDLEDLTSLNIQIFVSTSSDIRAAIERSYKE